VSARWLLLAALGPAFGCDAAIFGPNPSRSDPTASPTASVTPEPLDDPRDDESDDAVPKPAPTDDNESGQPRVPPEPLAADLPLPRDRIRGRELAGLALTVSVRRAAVPAAPNAPEVATEALRELQTEGQPRLDVELSDRGRMQITLQEGFLLEPETRLVARRERYGYALLWPRRDRYRVVPPGALRALLGEGRLDVTQLSVGRAETLPPGERLGFTLERHRIRTPVGEVDIELAEIPEAGAAAGLLCRFVVELAGATSAHPVCEGDRVLLGAELRWRAVKDQANAGLRFEVTALRRSETFEPGPFAMPPTSARFASGLPARAPGALLEPKTLERIRTGPTSPPESGPTLLPSVEATNASDRLLTLFVDAVPVALIRPWQTLRLDGFAPGRYVVHWRSFLGDTVGPTAEQWLPTKVTNGPPTEAPPTPEPPPPVRP